MTLLYSGLIGVQGQGWWWFQGFHSPEACQTKLRLSGWVVLPSVSWAALVFLGVSGRKYPCNPASFFLRQAGRQRVRSGTTRPLGQGSPGGLALALERKRSARLALRTWHCLKMTVTLLVFWSFG